MRHLGRQSQNKSTEKEALDIETVLIHYGFRYIPHGEGWRKVRCEFHGERRASATVNLELGAFKCFSCDMQGDTLKIIELAEKKEGRPSDFYSACRKYKEITGREAGGVRFSTPGESSGAVASEQEDFEDGAGLLRSRLRRNTNEGRQRTRR